MKTNILKNNTLSTYGNLGKFKTNKIKLSKLFE